MVRHGVDIFDCVAPTRNARHGSLYCGEVVPEGDWLTFASSEPRGRIMIKKAIYATDDKPIMENCDCYTCQHFSRAYLHFLQRERSMLFCNLASIHNIHVMQKTCEAMRALIERPQG